MSDPVRQGDLRAGISFQPVLTLTAGNFPADDRGSVDFAGLYRASFFRRPGRELERKTRLCGTVVSLSP